MTPYYQQDGITIYHGDCREILPVLGRCDLLLTDPPYGIAHKTGQATGGKWSHVRHAGVTVHDDHQPFDPAHLLALTAPKILWGANFYSDKLPGGGWLIWDKRPGVEDMDFNRSDAEVAYFSESRTVKTFRHLWHGLCRATEVGEHLHPTQKPVALMNWCLGLVPAAQVILDPYMGSGPVMVAAKHSGRRAIGIEINEEYCEIAATRLAQRVLPLEWSA